MTHTPPPKTLSHDEKKAADAAFTGRPFDDAWSASARTIYDGIVKAMPHTDVATPVLSDAEDFEEASSAQNEPFQPPDPLVQEHAPRTLHDREAAIQAGTLIDVTEAALRLGITFPVTITRPLWEMGIVTTHSLSEEEQTRRLRDILMAFRLRLSGMATVSPLLDFPVLLALPPNAIPEPVPLFALIQPDPTHRACVTLLLPNEVSLSSASLN